MLPKGLLGPVSSGSCRSPECATRLAGFEKQSLRSAPSEAAARQHRVPRGEADGGREPGAVRGRTTMADGASRSRSAGGGRGGGSEKGTPCPLRAQIPPRLVGPAGCKQRPPDECRRGPCKRRATISNRSVRTTRQAGDSLRRSVLGARRRAGLPTLSQQPPAGSYIRAGKSWTLAVRRITQEGRRREAPDLLGSSGTSRAPRRPSRRRSSPRSEPLHWTRDGADRPRFGMVLSPLRGEGRLAQEPLGTGVNASRSEPALGAPRRATMHDAAARLPYIRAGTSLTLAVPEITQEGRRAGAQTSRAADTLKIFAAAIRSSRASDAALWPT